MNIPIGPGNTTGRRLYRRFEYTGPWKLVTTLTNNSETTYLDKKPNARWAPMRRPSTRPASPCSRSR